MMLQASIAYSQTKETLYYDANWKGLDTKKKAAFYRVVNYDANDQPIGEIETYYMNGKLQCKSTPILINKLDDNQSLWKGAVTWYYPKGGVSIKGSFDEQGKLNGVQTEYYENGKKKREIDYDHGNYAKDYYLVYDKEESATKYSFLTLMPVKLATSGKRIVPLSARKTVYEEGKTIQYYFMDGISVAVQFSAENVYGNYYVAYITIENGTDKEFNFDPSGMISVLANGEKIEEADILSYNDYMKKVNRKQAWSAAFNSFAQRQAASQAGYSATTTSGYAYGTANSNSYATGNVGSTYGSASSNTNSSALVTGSSTTASYNGAAQYAANQSAANNIAEYNNQQYQIKNSITQGYLKLNTIYPSSRLIGYVNIKYEKATGILLNVPVNGKIYQFGG